MTRTHTLPDGRQLSSTYDGEPVGWTVHIVGADAEPTAGRDIRDALAALLELGSEQRPDWFIEAARDLAATDTPLGLRYPCACCGFLTLEEPPTGTYAICDVCYWEDDSVQFHDLDSAGGANKVSLNQARATFAKSGASEVRFRKVTRGPLPAERP